jgi:hypothetical protein
MDWLKQGVSTEDLAGLLQLAGQGRLRLVDGPCEDVFPGISLVPDFSKRPAHAVSAPRTHPCPAGCDSARVRRRRWWPRTAR